MKMKHADVPVPKRIHQRLPVSDNGYFKPWFVKGNDFRVMDEVKALKAIDEGFCWVCGGKLGRSKALVTGPKSAANGISVEPPCHHECALYSVKVCPFILLPKAQRREAGLPDELKVENLPPEVDVANPGMFIITVVKSYKTARMGMEYAMFYTKRDILRRQTYVEGNLVATPDLSSLVIPGANPLRKYDRITEVYKIMNNE